LKLTSSGEERCKGFPTFQPQSRDLRIARSA